MDNYYNQLSFPYLVLIIMSTYTRIMMEIMIRDTHLCQMPCHCRSHRSMLDHRACNLLGHISPWISACLISVALIVPWILI